jgi:hypothetical protein
MRRSVFLTRLYDINFISNLGYEAFFNIWSLQGRNSACSSGTFSSRNCSVMPYLLLTNKIHTKKRVCRRNFVE